MPFDNDPGLVAVHATVGVPANSDALPDPQPLDVLARGDDPAAGFMSRNYGVLRQPPVVIDGRETGVAQATILDGNLPLLPAERSGIVGKWLEVVFRAAHGPSANFAHCASFVGEGSLPSSRTDSAASSNAAQATAAKEKPTL